MVAVSEDLAIRPRGRPQKTHRITGSTSYIQSVRSIQPTGNLQTAISDDLAIRPRGRPQQKDELTDVERFSIRPTRTPSQTKTNTGKGINQQTGCEHPTPIKRPRGRPFKDPTKTPIDKEPVYLGTIHSGVHTSKRKSQRLQDKIIPPPNKIPRREGLNNGTSAHNHDGQINMFKGISNDYLDHGDPIYTCESCDALLWHAESTVGATASGTGSYSICFGKGKVKLGTEVKNPPQLLAQLMNGEHPKSKDFVDNIRRYNSMFSFTSMGAKQDTSVNQGYGPYCYRIHGENYHMMGSLLPEGDRPPVFAQLYIYDPQNEIQNRVNSVSPNDGATTSSAYVVDHQLTIDLRDMLDTINPLVAQFRMAGEQLLRKHDETRFRLRLIGTRERDGQNYNLPTADELGGLIVGDFDTTANKRDIILHPQEGGLKRISELHPSYLALHYPLLFPYAEDGYWTDIYHVGVTDHTPTNKKTRVTMREYFAYRLQERTGVFSMILNARRLCQQFIVDAYTMVESERMSFIKNQQKDLRSETYSKLAKLAEQEDSGVMLRGKKVILPSSFTGSPRYMMQNYLDAMTICKVYGYPDLFITFTCNPNWPEIARFVAKRGLKPEDRPDTITRVFKHKLDSLMRDFKDRYYFGHLKAAVYTVEFQKRGLPHAHILLFLEERDKIKTTRQIDRFISAEIPDKKEDPELYQIVTDHMMHGPCGPQRPTCPCTVKNKCTKKFPKEFNDSTVIDENGYALYKRRNDGCTVTKSGSELHNGYVVPYNPGLMRRYQSHINVEWCNQMGSIKYLFKYINKGPDRATAALEDQEIDEVSDYYDCRYLSACEAAWRIYKFDIHYRFPPVERLPFHLEGEHSVVFDASESIDCTLDKASINDTKFVQWMKTNETDVEARTLLYHEFPQHYVWKQDDRVWVKRQKGTSIGRVHHVSPSTGELFYLRVLINKVPGARDWIDFKKFEGVTYNTYKEACQARGLLEDDKEYIDGLLEASLWGTENYLRKFYVILILTDCMSRPEFVYEKTWEVMATDVLHAERIKRNDPDLELSDEQRKNICLTYIEHMLLCNNKSLRNIPNMPFPNEMLVMAHYNRLISDELKYIKDELREQHTKLFGTLTNEQRDIYNTLIDAVNEKKGGMFFVYGYGGTGKTYLYKTLSAAIRSKGGIVLNVASSGIAALLLEGGRTAHSRFAIPINVVDDSMCHIPADSELAELIRACKLIIWDEAPMTHRHCYEAFDRTLRDICRPHISTPSGQVFGGKVVLFGGDFRQILPVITNGSRQQIVHASINSSYLWEHCTVLRLNINMRLGTSKNNSERKEIQDFADWILSIGNGTIGGKENKESTVEFTNDMLIPDTEDHVGTIIEETYPDLLKNLYSPSYFQERAILAPTHELVDMINDRMLKLLDGDPTTYLSSDSIGIADEDTTFNLELYTCEFLNSIKIAGLPRHSLTLKIGTPVMCMRNIDQTAGLCNGTRLQVRRLGTNIIEAKIISGGNVGTVCAIPRLVLSPSETKIPFKFNRRQFPVSPCFAMTINKSQGQTLTQVGLFLQRPVFSHGQLYVAVSRVKNKKGLKILCCDDDGQYSKSTTNVVYKEALFRI